MLNDERITKQIKNSSDLFERSHETFNYIDVNDNTYLPYYNNGININSFGDLNKMLIENKKDICLLIENLFDSLLKTNIFINFDILLMDYLIICFFSLYLSSQKI